MFTVANTVEQMILDANPQLGGKQVPILHWNTCLSE
jgi:hypothetical protein